MPIPTFYHNGAVVPPRGAALRLAFEEVSHNPHCERTAPGGPLS